MRTDTATVVRLEDYRPSDFLIDRVDLDIRLHPTETRIAADLALRPNPQGQADAPLVLDGDELQLVAVAIDGRALPAGDYAATPQSLTILKPPQRPFTLTVETQVNPSANTKLMGLYRSGGVYCTQCEAEGFRRITYFLDRPDVLAVYTTRIEGDRATEPLLLGNGNPVEAGEAPGTSRHYAVWHDPFPKPSYLFAMVGGALGKVSKTFTTMSGRKVGIAVHVEPGKEPRASYALDALERAMRWDEETFGREYDLDVFNVVAVSDFNMGAMENKGLNIFNDRYVLASPETATDADYAAIEAIIAHEYFHNWSGNRVTCRDWFQLCLKEGLTVFRDQEFSSDMRSRPVHRISEVKTLRSRQFPEDAGPLAHPVRPAQYREINNFYTATVYEKGAEIVRMLKTLIGDEAFRRGMDLYFERNDGAAATVEDFLAAFADVTGKDLTHFAKWYEQAGTPHVAVTGHYDEASRTYRLDFAQGTPATPGQAEKLPMAMPVALGLVALDGGAMEPRCNRVNQDGVFVLDRAADSITFHDVPSRPVPSVFRGFSAPVKVSLDLSDDELLALLRHDGDPFNRWQAGQTVAMRFLVRGARAGGAEEGPAERLGAALAAFVDREALADPAFAALVLTLPSEAEIAQEIGTDVDPAAVFAAREAARTTVGRVLTGRLAELLAALADDGPYSPDSVSAGRRSLRQAALHLVGAADPQAGLDLAEKEYRAADNMTMRLGALSAASLLPSGERRQDLFDDFYRTYESEPLIIDKWFAVQAAMPEPETLDRVKGLMRDPAFSLSNPNRVRALIGSFAMGNATQFHRPDGAGYAFVADIVLELDPLNPQVAARLLTAFGTWKTVEGGRRAKAEAALRRIAAAPSLSPDVSDIVQRSLA
ncbi:MAG TPA: aminopeptidase N [Beijerinckiaceae bacterium]|jgi:aminopeptidase N